MLLCLLVYLMTLYQLSSLKALSERLIVNKDNVGWILYFSRAVSEELVPCLNNFCAPLGKRWGSNRGQIFIHHSQ
jgi:hypothetical protein